MNVLQYATRNDLPEATELRRRLTAIHALAINLINTEPSISEAKRRELVDALNREMAGL